MVLAVTILASLLAGYELSLRLWRASLASCERATYAVSLATLLWLASTWALALTSLLRREVLIARTLLLAAVALALLAKRRNDLRAQLDVTVDSRTAGFFIVALSPLVLWVVFSLWRGSLLPPLNHDALSYHLTKAVLYVREAGFRTFEDLSFVIPPRASNYEMLLADAIASDGSDRWSEWPSVMFYVGFVVAGVALAQRWWRIGAAASAGTALILGGVPVLLLHTSAHKNDLLFAFLAVSAFVAVGRALSDDDTAALALSIACLGAATGTKNHGAVIALAFAPLIAWRVFRPFDRRRIATIAVVTALSLVFLGSADQLVKLTRRGGGATPAAVTQRVGVPEYGDWQNLWQAPYLLLAAPFSPNRNALWVPWDGEEWFWRRYELFFSEFGVVFSIAGLALPFMMIATRKRRDDRRLERYAVTIATLVAFALLLPVLYRPIGLYLIYLPRFVLFVVPVVIAWSVPLLFERSRVIALVAGILVFSTYAIKNAVHDVFGSIRYVMWATGNPGTRAPLFDPYRAELVVDRMAGPRDVILIDAGHAAWVYPAYGASLQRDVRFIPPGDGPVAIPDDVDWVVVDRAYAAAWRNPDFQHLNQARKYLARPSPRPEDSRVLRAVSADPRFEVVSVRPASMQAIFRRRQPRDAAPR